VTWHCMLMPCISACADGAAHWQAYAADLAYLKQKVDAGGCVSYSSLAVRRV
jgi:hypothetical protein